MVALFIVVVLNGYRLVVKIPSVHVLIHLSKKVDGQFTVAEFAVETSRLCVIITYLLLSEATVEIGLQ